MFRTFVFAALAAVFAGVAEAQDVRPIGRTVTDGQRGLTIQWPSSGFSAHFEGASVRACIDDYGDNWLNVDVDGKTTRIDLQPGVQDYELFCRRARIAHDPRHTPHGPTDGPTRFIGITADRLTGTDGPARQILVIGDSITSGFGVEGKIGPASTPTIRTMPIWPIRTSSPTPSAPICNPFPSTATV